MAGAATKDMHAVEVLECSIMHDRRAEQLHPVSGAVLKALHHGYSVLFHGGDSTTRAPLVWLAVLRHCFGWRPAVGIQLLLSRGWKVAGELRACVDGLPERVQSGCALAETFQWVAGLRPLLAEGGSSDPGAEPR